jgi:hypothetical protein
MKTVMHRRWLPVAGATAALLLALAVAWWGRRHAPAFRDVGELQARAECQGLYCRSDRQDGRVTTALAISTRPLTWEELGWLCPGVLAPRAAGSGVAWAVNRSADLDGMPAPPWDGECRVWGGVLVTGDPELLDRLERAAG